MPSLVDGSEFESRIRIDLLTKTFQLRKQILNFHLDIRARYALVLTICTLYVLGCKNVHEVHPQIINLRVSVYSGKEESDLAAKYAIAFEANHPNIHIRIEPVAGMDNNMKLTMQSVAGTLPDVVFLVDSNVPTFNRYHIVKNLWPFIYNDQAFNVKDIYPQMLETGKDRNGSLYMLPRELGVVVMFYNRTLFRRAGLPDPSPKWTYDEFVEMAQKLTVRDSSGRTTQYGFRANYNWPGLYASLIYSEGGKLLSPDRMTSLLGSAKSAHALHLLTDMVTDLQIAAPQDATLTSQAIHPFSAGIVAMTPSVFPAVPKMRATMKQFDWDVQRMPRGSHKLVVTIGASGYGISETTLHPQESWQFLRFILSTEGQKILASQGSGIPALKSLAKDSCWRKRDLPPQNLNAFTDSVPYGMPWQDSLIFADPEVVDVVNEAFDRVFLKQKSVEKAFDEADSRISEILKKRARQ